MLDWEHGIVEHAMQGNCASSLAEGEVSWFFSRCGRNLVYILELWQGWQFNICVYSATSALLSSYDGLFSNINKASRNNTDASLSEE